MGKKSGFLFMGLLSGITAGGVFAGSKLYDEVMKPVGHKEGDDKSNLITEGRRFIRQNTEKRDIFIDAIDNLRLHAVYIAANKDAHKYVILVHGTNDDGESMGIYAKKYLEKDVNVLIPDLRGFGQSEGNYIGYGGDDRFDIIEWIYWIVKRDADANILLHGVSMGAASVLMACGENLPENVKGAISDSAYTSVKEIFTNAYKKMQVKKMPLFIAMPLLRIYTKIRAGFDFFEIRPIDAVTRSTTPTLFVHGDADKVVDSAMCRRLYNSAKCQRMYYSMFGCGHIEGVWKDSEGYWNKINEFTEQVKF